jgi:DNA-binding LacI/PurR family transcriptional regulator
LEAQVTTIYDVAKAAGVTATTVSYVLSGKGSISKATRAKVMQCAHELGYRPNLVARSLIKQSTSTIGLVVPNIGNPFYAGLAEAVERIAYTSGFRVYITNTYGDERLGMELLDDLMSRRVDGILATSAALPPQAMDMMTRTQLPIVHCLWEGTAQENAPSASVNFDFAAAGRLVAEHLLALGHRRIGIVAHGKRHEDGIEITHRSRVDGCTEVLAESGHPFDPALLDIGNSTLESGKIAGLRLLTSPAPPSAIFATNDLMALGIMSAAWELGMHIPRDLSIVGFDDIAQATYNVPPLTTIVMSAKEIAEQALGVLFSMLEGKTVSSPPLLQPILAVRGSTAPVRE